jgi:aromatic ring-opening dioxygenase catalytic subunit (LigB family)
MKDEREGLTRREVIASAIGGVVLAAVGEAAGADAQERRARSNGRLPVVYLPHGGGPWPFVELGFADRREMDSLSAYLRTLADLRAEKPRALLVVSAHWEEDVPTVMTSTSPPMLYDYYGFPPESYELSWPAPGDPRLAERVLELLDAAHIRSATSPTRGFDHGTFVPLKVTYPEADVPAIQLSLKRGLDPAEHLAIGRALAPLRDEGVLILGSGMSYHNMRGFGGRGRAAAETFDEWLGDAARAAPAERDSQLSSWDRAPSARDAHPREEHLLPLMVVAGAAGNDRGRVAFNDTFSGVKISAFQFGT